MLAIIDSFQPQCGEPTPTPTTATMSRPLEWRSRYDGLVSVAYIGGKAVAGISGPWSGKFALTWWERPMPSRQLELHDSMEAAKNEVEDWALRMNSGGYDLPLPQLIPLGPARNDTSVDAAAQRQPGLFDRVRAALLPLLQPSASEKIDRLRRAHVHNEPDLSGLHFAANE
jgi:hypothetical protein